MRASEVVAAPVDWHEARLLCAEMGISPQPPAEGSTVGVSRGALLGQLPLHGLRRPAHANDSGWLLWTGVWSDEEGFFGPLDMEQVPIRVPAAQRFLALPPGWRFFVDAGYENIWEDSTLTLTE